MSVTIRAVRAIDLTFDSSVRLARQQASDGGHHLLRQLLLAARAGAADDAMLDVVVEQPERDLVERRLDRADLRQHVDAVALLVDHLLHAARLALDSLEPRE